MDFLLTPELLTLLTAIAASSGIVLGGRAVVKTAARAVRNRKETADMQTAFAPVEAEPTATRILSGAALEQAAYVQEIAPTQLGTHWERSVQGGSYTHTQHLRPIAYAAPGVGLRRIVSDWVQGDEAEPHMVSEAGLRVRTAPNGDRRILPVPTDDDAWFSISSPYIKVAGVWQQPSLGAFSRSGNLLSAQTANVNTYIWHAGHYVKAGFLLKNGWTPPNSQFAFRLGLNGLTRSGGVLSYNGTPVMHLRAPVVYDWDNPDDTRLIAHEFVQLGGAWYVLFTLPSLAGMTRPVVDPVVTLRPDAASGLDTYLNAASATTNFGTNTRIFAGKNASDASQIYTSLLAFTLTAIPAGSIVSSATLSLWSTFDRSTIARTMRFYRCLRNWVESRATWNIYSTGNNWQTAGARGALDADGVDSGSGAMPAGANAGIVAAVQRDFTVLPATVQAWVRNPTSNYGYTVRMDTEISDAWGFESSDGATAGQRPRLVIVYTLPRGSLLRHGGRIVPI